MNLGGAAGRAARQMRERIASSFLALRYEFHRPGAVNALIPMWGFVTDDVFLTKSGAVGMVWQCKGIDYEGLDEEDRRRYVHDFETALRMLDSSHVVYQYLLKSQVDTCRGEPRYTSDLYLVVVSEWTSRAGRINPFSLPQTTVLMETHQQQAVTELRHIGVGLERHLDAIQPRRLGMADAFRFFMRLTNDVDYGTRHRIEHMDRALAQSPLERHRRHLVLGDTPLVVLSMKASPGDTFATQLAELYALPGEFTVCVEWQRLDDLRARARVKAKQNHFHGQKVAPWVYVVTKDPKPHQILIDKSQEKRVDELGDALAELDKHPLGECAITLILKGADTETLAASARQKFAAFGGEFIQERENLLHAWQSTLPGNSAHSWRRVNMLVPNAADLCPVLFSVDQGSRLDENGHPAMINATTQQNTPFWVQPFVGHVKGAGGVGHTAVFGQVNSGKTTLLGEMIKGIQCRNPRTVILDIGHGYKRLAEHYGGSYLTFGVNSGVKLNPFALPATDENLEFLAKFCHVLIRTDGGGPLEPDDDAQLFTAVEHVMTVPGIPERRLRAVVPMVPVRVQKRLARWVGDGRHAHLFDHATDDLNPAAFQVFEFEHLREFPELLDPLLFYVLRLVNQRLSPSQTTFIFMDEAGLLIQDPILKGELWSWLIGLRKKNAALVIATQAVEHFDEGFLRTVVESCQTVALLANPLLNQQTYQRIFGLNDAELELLVNVKPRRQFLLKRHGFAKVLDLTVDTPAAPVAVKVELAHV